ncbi:acetylglutamate kinase [Siminovitchia sp. FSL W7-1587]|uniref:acetylglutamate kinase n=1 Tax=Siminovitchia sp. FSL W7-1587 TaxID=2954699 RepID=UPI0030D36B17
MSKIIVIKFGGSMIDSLSDEFYEGIKKLKDGGWQPLIVHGGGPAINQMLHNLKIKSEFHNGLRKTTKAVMDVVEMVLSGSMTNTIVRNVNNHGLSAIGMTGFDGPLLEAKPIDFEKLGYVGEITHVNKHLLLKVMALGMIPVISPIAPGADGKISYNINADTAAGSIATALDAEKLLFVTDVPGILKNEQLMEVATKSEILNLINEGTITGGMIPKVKAALDSLDEGMSEVMIVSGNAHIVSEGKIIGTTIKKELEEIPYVSSI